MVTALINKAKGMNVVTLNNILYKVLPEVKTNMTSDEFLGFTINVLTYAGYAVQSNYSVPQPKDYTGQIHQRRRGALAQRFQEERRRPSRIYLWLIPLDCGGAAVPGLPATGCSGDFSYGRPGRRGNVKAMPPQRHAVESTLKTSGPLYRTACCKANSGPRLRSLLFQIFRLFPLQRPDRWWYD